MLQNIEVTAVSFIVSNKVAEHLLNCSYFHYVWGKGAVATINLCRFFSFSKEHKLETFNIIVILGTEFCNVFSDIGAYNCYTIKYMYISNSSEKVQSEKDLID